MMRSGDLGIDLAEDAVRILQLGMRRGKLQVLASAMTPFMSRHAPQATDFVSRPPPTTTAHPATASPSAQPPYGGEPPATASPCPSPQDSWETALREALRPWHPQRRFRWTPPRRRCVLALPAQRVWTRFLQLPGSIRAHALEGSLWMEVAQWLPYPLAEIEMDFRLLASPSAARPEWQIQVSACHKNLLQERLRLMEAVGLEPVTITVDTESTARAVAYLTWQHTHRPLEPLEKQALITHTPWQTTLQVNGATEPGFQATDTHRQESPDLHPGDHDNLPDNLPDNLSCTPPTRPVAESTPGLLLLLARARRLLEQWQWSSPHAPLRRIWLHGLGVAHFTDQDCATLAHALKVPVVLANPQPYCSFNGTQEAFWSAHWATFLPAFGLALCACAPQRPSALTFPKTPARQSGRP